MPRAVGDHSQVPQQWVIDCTRPSKLSTNRPFRAEKNEAPPPAAFTQGGRLLSGRGSQLSPEGLQFLDHERIQVTFREHGHGQPDGFIGKENRGV